MTFALLSVLLLFIGALLTVSRHQRIHKSIELRPNCLLTRHPIVFLTKKRWFTNSVSRIASNLLEQHGYDILELDFTCCTKQKRRDLLNSFFELSQKAGEKYYIVTDLELLNSVAEVKQKYGTYILGTWCISGGEPLLLSQFGLKNNFKSNQRSSGPWYKLLVQKFKTKKNHVSILKTGKCLEWAISLAENELRC